MGLDMYLSVKKYISKIDFERGTVDGAWPMTEKFKNAIDGLGYSQFIDPNDVTGLTVEIPLGYWRKANQIHHWFVEKCGGGKDECQEIEVSRDELKDLRDACLICLGSTPEECQKILPTHGGFFFGSTEYDNYYMEDIKDTIKIIDRALASPAEYFIYQASW